MLNLYQSVRKYMLVNDVKMLGFGLTPFTVIPLIILIILKNTKPEKKYLYVEDNQDEN